MIALRALVTVAALVGLMLPIGGAVDAPRPTHVAHLPQKTIALSFDDIPRAPGAFYSREERTQRLIAALKASGVRQAAFFVNPGRVGTKGESFDLVQAYAAAGHALADHTFSHQSLAVMPASAFLADIDRAETWLKARPGYRPWFRFPGLNQGGTDRAKRRAVLDGLTARGLLVGAVTIDGSDWYLERLTLEAAQAGRPIDEDALHDLYIETMVQSAEFSDALMRRTIGRSPAHVMLLHETDLAARYIGDLVEALRNRGWRIVTADAAYRDPIYHTALKAPTGNGTLSEAMAWEKGIAGPRWYDRNDARIAGALFDQRVMHQPPGILASVPDRHRQCRARHRGSRRPCTAFAVRAARTLPSGTFA